ncbi:TetR/AcrR family transcriptional regulator [Cryptosporangium sp. NPDC048952]|uniref:TetR/AcrR family transcriptional regulator n=1 Tax=Cryptosporangium sp. NPDC048952 TaxID=3363961 RepID=UPI00371EA5EF
MPATRRQDSAAQTRTVILDAALELFSAQGYGPTTVNQIAEGAGVAAATVYTSVGNKPTVLRALVERSASAVEFERNVADVAASTDPRAVIDLIAAGTRAGFEAHDRVIALMVETATTIPEVAADMERSVTTYRANLRAASVRLNELAALRHGVSVDQGTDTLWFFFGLYSYPTLVRDNRWSYDEAQAWLADRAAEALL